MKIKILLSFIFLFFAIVHPLQAVGIFAYITNSGDGTVSVVDTATNMVVQVIPVGNNPQAVTIHPAGTFVYVANLNDDTISIINTTTNAVDTTIPLVAGSTPQGIAVNPTGAFVYVANFGNNTISVINTTTNTLVTNIPIGVGKGPYAITVNAAGTFIYVTNDQDNTVSVIDTSTNTVTAENIIVGANPEAIIVNSAGTFAYVGNFNGGSVSVIDTSNNTVVTTIPVDTGPSGLAFANSLLYETNLGSSSISVINPITNTVIQTITAAELNACWGISSTPNGARVYVANTDGSSVSVIDTTSNEVIDTITSGDGIGANPVALGLFITPLSAVNLSSSNVVFAEQSVGSSSAAQTVTLTNTGNGLLLISSIAITGSFSQTNDCGTSLIAGATCTISIIFTPTTSGEESGSIIITDNTEDSPQTITLLGTGSSSSPLNWLGGGGCALSPSDSLLNYSSLWMAGFLVSFIFVRLRCCRKITY